MATKVKELYDAVEKRNGQTNVEWEKRERMVKQKRS